MGSLVFFPFRKRKKARRPIIARQKTPPSAMPAISRVVSLPGGAVVGVLRILVAAGVGGTGVAVIVTLEGMTGAWVIVGSALVMATVEGNRAAVGVPVVGFMVKDFVPEVESQDMAVMGIGPPTTISVWQ